MTTTNPTRIDIYSSTTSIGDSIQVEVLSNGLACASNSKGEAWEMSAEEWEGRKAVLVAAGWTGDSFCG